MALKQAGLPGQADCLALAQADRVAMLRMLVDAGELAALDPCVLAGLGPFDAACFEKLRHEEH